MPDDEPLLDLDSRRRIFRQIEGSPGLHLRGLQRALEMPLGTLEYHLHQMERSGLIVSRDDGRFKAFFAKEGLDRRDKDILYYVRQEMPRQIVVQLLLAPGLTHSELTERLPISASTCSFHLKKLVGAGLVTEERVGRTKRFNVVDPDRAGNVLVRYRKSFFDDLVDRFVGAWLDMGNASEPVPGRAEPDASPSPRAEGGPAAEESDEADEDEKKRRGGGAVSVPSISIPSLRKERPRASGNGDEADEEPVRENVRSRLAAWLFASRARPLSR